MQSMYDAKQRRNKRNACDDFEFKRVVVTKVSFLGCVVIAGCDESRLINSYGESRLRRKSTFILYGESRLRRKSTFIL